MADLVSSMFKDIALGRINKLINNYIDDQYEYQRMDVKEKFKQMRDNFTKVQALVAVAEEMEIEENQSFVDWLYELKNAVYDAEYVMDVFEYRRLKNEVEGWPQTTQLAKDKGKMCRFLKVSSNVQERASVIAKRLLFADEDVNDLLEVVTKLDNLVKEMNNFTSLLQLYHSKKYPMVQQDAADNEVGKSRETTSVPVELNLFGRDEIEKKFLEKLLQRTDGSETGSFSVVSIVGVGGVGKTTLAQSIFNHDTVKDYFDVTAWVCVSTNFNSRNMMKCAFGTKNPENYPQFKNIGEEIALKLGGIPLAAKTVGRVLSTSLNIDHWKDVLNSKVWKENKGVMSALKLSYDHLPIHLKKCFVLCCLFPKDYYYKSETLLDIWVALDCVRPNDKNKRLVDIQRTYIDELVNRCILETRTIEYVNEYYYVIHDLLHDLAEKIIGHEVYRVEDDESLSKEVPQPQYVRHLYVKATTYSALNLVLQQLKIAPKQLRSLVYVVYGERRVEEAESKMSEETIQKLKGLRLIFLETDFLGFEENIGDLLHLRCANFDNHFVSAKYIMRLHQLEILRQQSGGPTKECYYLYQLINLRYAKIHDEFPSNEVVTSYLGCLKSLEEVPGGKYIINREEGNDLTQLQMLDKIGGKLTLDVHAKLSETEARKANLSHKAYLTKLTIIEDDKKGDIEGKAIEALQPHKNLQELEIEGCRIITMPPTWISMLSNLATLRLTSLPNLQGFPPHIGHLMFLKKLWLQSLPSVKQIDVAADSNGHFDRVLFPSLVHVEMSNMTNLEGWSLHNHTTKRFPKLSVIEILQCPKLLTKDGSLPHCIAFPFPEPCNIRLIHSSFYYPRFVEDEMIELHIDEHSLFAAAADDFHDPKTSKLFTGIKELVIQYIMGTINPLMEALSQKFSSLEVLRINCYEHFKVDNFAVQGIKKLIISWCQDLKFLSATNSLQAFSSLETLVIDHCNVDDILVPVSIKELIIKRCSSLRFVQLVLTLLSSLETLIVEDCSALESLTFKHSDNNQDDVDDSYRMQSIPPPSIKTLIMKECPKLQLTSATLQMVSWLSIEELEIVDCEELERSLRHAQLQQTTM